MTETKANMPTFEEWMESGPSIPTQSQEETDHVSWRCGGGPHIQDPENPRYKAITATDNTPEPTQPDTIKKIIPGSTSSLAEPADRYKQGTADTTWESFRDNIRRLQAKRNSHDTAKPRTSTSDKGTKAVMSGLLNELDNNL